MHIILAGSHLHFSNINKPSETANPKTSPKEKLRRKNQLSSKKSTKQESSEVSSNFAPRKGKNNATEIYAKCGIQWNNNWIRIGYSARSYACIG